MIKRDDWYFHCEICMQLFDLHWKKRTEDFKSKYAPTSILNRKNNKDT